MEIPNRQEQIDALARKYLGDPEQNGNERRPHIPLARTDQEIIDKARAERGGKFDRMWQGDTSDYGHDASSADDGFVHKLWSYTQDEDQVKRIHAASGLHRAKSGRRADYLQRSINRAQKNVDWFYDWETHPKVTVGDKSNPTNPANPTNPTNSANPTNRPQPISAVELMAKEFAPTSFVVEDVLPEGLTLLAGKPKKGKSWMALGVCESVAAGAVAFGTKRVQKGESLYLALEDNHKRLQKRLKKVLNGRAAPEGMHLHTEWPRLDEGGAELLDEWLTEHPEARLVVIDTLAKIRKPARGQNVYAEDYAALEQLLPLAAKHGVAIVVVHHLRKMAAPDPMDEISSSTGLTAGVDGFLILRRTPGSKGPTLYVDGRDIEEPTEYALHWNMNTATWTIEGDADEVHLSKERADILLTLNRSAVPMTPKEVSDVMPGAKYNNVKYLMWTMLGDGQLVKDDGGRYSPANPTNPPTNPTNPQKGDRYGESDQWVSGVSGVSGVGREELTLENVGSVGSVGSDDGDDVLDTFPGRLAHVRRPCGQVVHARSGHPYDVYVGNRFRPAKGWPALPQSEFGNPYKKGRDGNLDEVIEKFRRDLEQRVAADEEYAARVRGLVGKTLACWCAGKGCDDVLLPDDRLWCHAQILLRVANRLADAENGEAEEAEQPPRTKRRTTPEEAQKIQRLISQGMKPELARAEVLGDEA